MRIGQHRPNLVVTIAGSRRCADQSRFKAVRPVAQATRIAPRTIQRLAINGGAAALRAAVVCTALLVCCGARAEPPHAKAQELWLVNTRAAPKCSPRDDGFRRIRYWRLEDDCSWATQDASQFSAGKHATAPTVIFIHGSRTDDDTAIQLGFHVYRDLQRAADGRAFRCEIWSWPSDREQLRPRPDMQRKLVYCETQSRYLAQRLGDLKPETPVCLIGYSFGARIITGALERLARGATADCETAAQKAEHVAAARNPMRVILLAAAMDYNSLASGCSHGRAMSMVDRALITQNPCDRVLRWYPRLYGRGGPAAMGAVGPALTEGAEKAELIDMSGTVGRIHDVRCYLASGEFHSRLARYAFLDDDAPVAVPQNP